MDRRTCLRIIAAAGLVNFATIAGAQEAETKAAPVLGTALRDLDKPTRIKIQDVLKSAGLYDGESNGIANKDTRKAVRRAAKQVESHSNGAKKFDLSQAESAKAFLAALAAGELTDLLGAGGKADKAEKPAADPAPADAQTTAPAATTDSTATAPATAPAAPADAGSTKTDGAATN